MFNKIKDFIIYITAKNEDIELKQRVLILSAFAGFSLALFGFIVNYFLSVGLLAKLLPFIFLIITVFLFYKVRFGKNFETYSLVTYITSMFLVFIISIFNGGVESGNIVVFVFILVIGTIVLPSKFKFLGFILFLFAVTLLFYINFFYPEKILYFDSKITKYLDIYLGTIFTSYLLYILINYLYTSYYREHDLLKVKEENLKMLNNQLSDTLITKEKFYSIIAHDLRNPISNFNLTTNLILDLYDTMSDEEKKEFLTLIRDSSKDLQEMLETLLNLIKNNQGTLPLLIDKVTLNLMLRKNIEFIKLQAINKNIELINNYNGYIDVKVDKSYLDVILRNLLSNALKFTNNNGKIIIDVDENYKDENVLVEDNQEEYVKVSIIDNGIGMTEDIKAKLFNVDQLITSKGTNKEAGNGLGLLLCKEFIEKMGGKIWFDSEENKGTTFYFTLKK